MSNQESDAIVFFGASGDLAYKQIFPSLLRLVRDEGINVPIVGVAKSAWTESPSHLGELPGALPFPAARTLACCAPSASDRNFGAL